MCVFSVNSQVIDLKPNRNYQIISSDGFAFGCVDDAAKLCEVDADDRHQAFQFVQSEDNDGTYMIKLAVDDRFVCKNTSWNDWDITFETSLPAEVSRAKYTIEAIEGTDYVGIKNMHKSGYWGWDTPEPGNGVYCDKALGDKSKWKIVELPIDAQTMFEDSYNRLVAFGEGLGEYPGIQTEVSDYSLFVYDKASGASSPSDEIYYECISDINEFIKKINETISYISSITNVYDECEDIFESESHYPGISDLTDTYQETKNIYDSQESRSEDYVEALDNLAASLKTYYNSQIPFASEEQPADLTYFIKYPNFRKSYKYTPESEVTSEGWVSYATGQLPSWATNIGAQHKYTAETGRDVTCFAGWSQQYDIMEVYQDIDSLPEGKYQVECDAFTELGKVYKQRAFATSGGVTVSDFATEAMSGAWETFKTDPIVVFNGKLRLGFSTESPIEGGTAGWYIVTGFKLKYCGEFTDDDIKELFRIKLDDCKALRDTMMFKGDRAVLGDTISKYENSTDVDAMKQAIEALSDAQIEAEKSASKQVEVKNGIWSELTDSISQSTVFTGDYAEMISNICDCMNGAVNADDAVYTQMDSLQNILYRVRDNYLPVLYQARNTFVDDVTAKNILEDNIDRQMSHLTETDELPSTDTLDKYVGELQIAMKQCKAADLYKSGTRDFTSLIVNPGIDNSSNTSIPEGWNVYRIGAGNSNYTSSGQQVDGNPNGCYLDGWHPTNGNLLYNGYQTIEYLPNGKYEMKAMVRTTSNHGVYLYAIADNDSSTTTLKQLTMETMNITELGGPKSSTGEDSIATVHNQYGSIFAELYKRTDGGANATDAQADTLNANGGIGHGWFYDKLEIEVKNHILTIGFTCDSTFTMKYGGVPFEGYSISADNFTLRLLEEGDNTDWNPASGIIDVEDSESEALKYEIHDGTIVSNGNIYSINGTLIPNGARVPAGIYIIRLGEQTVKVLVK